jgi:hypothetical protein
VMQNLQKILRSIQRTSMKTAQGSSVKNSQ